MDSVVLSHRRRKKSTIGCAEDTLQCCWINTKQSCYQIGVFKALYCLALYSNESENTKNNEMMISALAYTHQM